MFEDLFGDSERNKYMQILGESNIPLDNRNYWWVRNPKRCVKELSQMLDNTDSIHYFDNGKLIWEVEFENNFGTYFLISIETDSNYPFTAPKVFVKKPDIGTCSKHVYGDKSLCLFHPDAYSPSMSILEIRNFASSWAFCWDAYEHSSQWPGAEVPH